MLYIFVTKSYAFRESFTSIIVHLMHAIINTADKFEALHTKQMIPVIRDTPQNH